MVTVFRRKLGWLACFVALAVVAILAAAVFYALSALGVGQYTAYVCFVVPRPESLVDRFGLPTADARDRFQAIKASYAQKLTSGYVLTHALGQPQTQKLASVRNVRDPVAWLQRRLFVSFPGNAELMVVSLRSREPQEAVTLVNAVADAFLDEVVKPEVAQRQERLKLADRACADIHAELIAKRQELRKLAGEVGQQTDPLVAESKMAWEELAAHCSERTKARFEVRRLQAELAGQDALLRHIETMTVPAAEIDSLVENDPWARQLRAMLILRKLDQTQIKAAAKPGEKDQKVDRVSNEIKVVQEQLDLKSEELKEKAREKHRAAVEMEVARLEAVIAAMQEQDKAEANEIDKLLAKAFRIGKSLGPQPEVLRAEIEELEAGLKRAQAERDERKAEIDALPRIVLYERAEVTPLEHF